MMASDVLCFLFLFILTICRIIQKYISVKYEADTKNMSVEQ